MRRKKTRKRSGNGIPASVKKELAKPRMAKSARLAKLILDGALALEPPPTITTTGK